MVNSISIKMYGSYSCACGCGKPLGTPTVGLICKGVGKPEDEEGYEWRMFTPDCYDRISRKMTLDEMYNNFESSPLNE